MRKTSLFVLLPAVLVVGMVSVASASGVTCRTGVGCLNGTDHFDWTTNYGPPVIFQDVVHSIGTREADCGEQFSFRGTTEHIHKNARLTLRSQRCWFSRLLLVCD